MTPGELAAALSRPKPPTSPARTQLLRIVAYALAATILAGAAGFGFTLGVELAHLVTR